ncbi:protein kinase [Halorubrum ezzemoulense]|nr:protein kinase [Halorubrum ezzemoulense]MDB2245248.1 protein kinase [Halorubrum ezzemoulense]MDB2290104.1 protein kinase [Halorubrum ezzemoulense]MDB2297574.1 protein kinase [Halorubrum ezzemoulense]MDB2301154.1 protein kinase [Halorubrum ezzemoulense]
MTENEEDEDLPGVLERFQNEVTTLERHFEVLKILYERSPVGNVEIANELGYPQSKVRFSLRVLEEENLIEPTAQGAVLTDDADDEIEGYNQKLDQLQNQIASTANEELGVVVNTTTSSSKGSTTDTPPTDFVSTASPTAVADRFGSFDPLLEHDDSKVREVAVKRLVELAENNPKQVTEFASLSVISERLLDESDDVVHSGFTLLEEIVEHDPDIAQPALPVLIDLINRDDTLVFVTKAINLFGEIASSDPEEARSIIDRQLVDLPAAKETKRVNVANSLNGVVASEGGPKILKPFLSPIVGLLEDPSEDVRIPAAGIIQEFAESDAVSLDGYHANITELLTDDSPRAREIGVEIAANLGTLDTEIVTTVRKLAEEDPNEDVRTTASDVLNTMPSTDMDSTAGDDDLTRTTELEATQSVSGSEGSESGSRSDTGGIRDKIPTPSDVVGAESIELSYEQFQFDEEADLIGTGGQARVYRADVPEENITIALKQPSFSTTVSTDTYDHILKEAHNWSQWDDHPHIVQVLDWGTQPGPWIALEYMDGGTLDEYIGSMSVEQRLWTAYMIGSAVAYANIKGLAHHDIKPNNILFRKTPEGKWNLPKVADWGLSREIIQATGSISQATPDYAAPEHFNAIMPEEPVDERTDIYQLGVICYEVLTGTHPNHLRGNVPLPSTIDESLPSGIDDVISKAIIQDRDERYEHALVFRQEIETVLSSEFPSLLDD